MRLKARRLQDTKQKENMSTLTKTKTAATVATLVSNKLTVAVRAIIAAVASTESAMLIGIRTLQSEAKRMGLDRKGAGQLVYLSYREAKRGTPGGLPADKSETEEQVKAFDTLQRFNVSKLLGLAFPDADRAADVEKGLKHDEAKTGQKHGRIGTNRLLKVASGAMTIGDAIAGKAATRTNGNSPEPKVEDLSATALENAFAGIRLRFVKPEHFTPEAARTIALLVFCDGPYSPKAVK